ncbi:hypothetical protein FGO68_gene15795 [Halteria grandinella]|uniref:Uncharacterized protein n=1 Tax=Halteria grandinella TaxID=5974 RepID=A0A8J8T601_HALGN|nr:hypothetical protein FGO68_gene15795 [Halteria grandinella]
MPENPPQLQPSTLACALFFLWHASIQWQQTSTCSERPLILVSQQRWHTLHPRVPTLVFFSSLTSTQAVWLQQGQSKTTSSFLTMGFLICFFTALFLFAI